ncbi:MAG: hypothetical protein WAV53_01580 [Anaerolineae bacterium]
MTYYEITIRPTYLSNTDEVAVRLGSGRRPRVAASTRNGDVQACLDTGGRLVRLLLADSKVLHLGQRLSGLPVVENPPQPVSSGLIGYDLATRVATIFLFPTPDSAIAQNLVRTASFDFDASDHLLAVRIPAGPTARREPDLYRALAFLK